MMGRVPTDSRRAARQFAAIVLAVTLLVAGTVVAFVWLRGDPGGVPGPSAAATTGTVRATTGPLGAAGTGPAGPLAPARTSTPAPTPRATTTSPALADRDPASGLRWVEESTLPSQARETLALIRRGGPYPYPRNDDQTFGNREGLLPGRPSGYYREYTVVTPGSPDRGARRIVAGRGGEFYYTDDHYDSFRRIREGS